MMYLNTFRLASADEEDTFVLSFPHQLEMQCYTHENVYPFKLFPQKGLQTLHFAPITVFYGGNGSGKSTILNILSEKLQVQRSAPFNDTPFMEEYLKLCDYELAFGRQVPRGSRKITSDDVFDYLLDTRSINERIDRRRDALFAEYDQLREDPMMRFRSLSDFESFKQQNEAKRKTKSVYVSKRLPKELNGRSNGESAYLYFTQKIESDALYLLDEPENSLSAQLQQELVQFIEDSVRFYNCQFIISTHSPFLLAMRDALIYDLDSVPVKTSEWTELKNVRVYYEFFKRHMGEFE